jgi:hypothetical protein
MSRIPGYTPLTDEQKQFYAHWNTDRLICDPTGLYKQDIQALLQAGFSFLVERGTRSICLIPLKRPGVDLMIYCTASTIQEGTRKIVSNSLEADLDEAVQKFSKGYAWVKKGVQDEA